VSGPVRDLTAPWLVVVALAGALSPWLTTTAPVFYGVLLALAIVLARMMALPSRLPIGGPLLIASTCVAALAAMPLAITPSRADAFSKAAAAFESQRQWPDAVAAYREATRLQPREPYYFAGLGRSLLQEAAQYEPAARSARLQASRAAYERALALRPSDPDNIRHLASQARMEAASRPEGREAPLAEADRLYADATRRMPGLMALWVDWGWVDVDRGRWPDALEKASHAIALNPNPAGAFVLRGYIHATQSKFEAALADYDAALAREYDNGDALRGRAAVLAALRR
jgi:tetratricopeptide (TPR) repeat protein